MSPILDSLGSAKGFGWSFGEQNNYWFDYANASQGFGNAGSIFVDAQKNVYTANEFGSTPDNSIAKFGPAGNLLWRYEYGTSQDFSHGGIAVDSSSNVYIAGTSYTASLSRIFTALKLDSSGNISWSKFYNSSNPDYANDVKVGPSGNIYVCGNRQNVNGYAAAVLVKFNSDGTKLFGKNLYYSIGTNSSFIRLKIDSSENIYLAGYYYDASQYVAWTSKYDSSGTLLWSRGIPVAEGAFARDVAVDSSSNVYVVGNSAYSGSGYYRPIIYKYDSSGTIQWQKALIAESNGSASYTSIHIDQNNDIYVGGYDRNGGVSSYLIVKYDTSGNVIWQRRISRTSWYGQIQQIYVFGKTIAITGTFLSDEYRVLNCLIPTDGSKTGTYTVGGQSFVYSASSYSATTPSLSTTTPSLNNENNSDIFTNGDIARSTTVITDSLTTI